MNKEENRAYWATKVGEFRASCQSVAAWCRENNVKPHQINYWLSRE